MAVSASAAGVMGSAGWSDGCLYAPLGATVMMSGSVHWLGGEGGAFLVRSLTVAKGVCVSAPARRWSGVRSLAARWQATPILGATGCRSGCARRACGLRASRKSLGLFSCPGGPGPRGRARPVPARRCWTGWDTWWPLPRSAPQCPRGRVAAPARRPETGSRSQNGRRHRRLRVTQSLRRSARKPLWTRRVACGLPKSPVCLFSPAPARCHIGA